MASENDFIPFATGAGANVESPSTWAADAVVPQGFQVGTANPTQANTAWRQATFVAAAVAQFMADTLDAYVQDNGSVADFEAQLLAAIQQVASATQRIRLQTNTTFYVSPTGSDGNNGLGPGTAWLTIQHAWNTIQENYDINGFTVIIQLADGSYGESFVPSGLMIGQFTADQVVLNGDSATPTNVVIDAVTGAGAVAADYDATLVVQNLQVQGVTGIAANHNAKVFLSNVVFGTITNFGLYALFGGDIEAIGALTVLGSMAAFANATIQGRIALSTPGIAVSITTSGTPAFSTAFVACGDWGLIYAPRNTFVGGATGQRYIAGLGGGIDTNGGGSTYFPGSTPGAVDNPGYYA